ncbi:hypothetical protein HDV05_004437 [Chytridiales sp. JEL 0842]|nr:hypothetical protein HDV05_004437 [Chytridiales sp. JEL 0842]
MMTNTSSITTSSAMTGATTSVISAVVPTTSLIAATVTPTTTLTSTPPISNDSNVVPALPANCTEFRNQPGCIFSTCDLDSNFLPSIKDGSNTATWVRADDAIDFYYNAAQLTPKAGKFVFSRYFGCDRSSVNECNVVTLQCANYTVLGGKPENGEWAMSIVRRVPYTKSGAVGDAGGLKRLVMTALMSVALVVVGVI